jgi:DNA-binding MurR/RpiR family transcriptional regulator
MAKEAIKTLAVRSIAQELGLSAPAIKRMSQRA